MKAYYYCFLLWWKKLDCFFFQKNKFSQKKYFFFHVNFFFNFSFPANTYVRFQQMRSQMKAYYYCFLFWGKNPIFFPRTLNICKKCIFWRQIFLENIVFCQYIFSILTTLKWNDRIPSISFSKKSDFFSINLDEN